MSLFIFTVQIPDGAKAGRELLAELNAQALTEAAEGRAELVVVDAAVKPAGLRGWLLATLGWLNGMSPAVASDCLAQLTAAGARVLYLEGSNYGRLARLVRKRLTSCQVVTFFHNVEARFFWGAFRARPSAKAAAVLFANWLAERWAVKYSHRIICLNERDSSLLRRLYGRGATDIHPMCISAPREAKPPCGEPPAESEPFGLFVGGAFYANLWGMRWFQRHVAARLPCKIYVVGKGFEKYRDELESNPNVRVIGTVDSLVDWYRRCSFVIAPIFDGSGMKTKVAEALMYGRPVVGTTEAFVGYEAVASRVGIVCDEPAAFVSAVEAIVSKTVAFHGEELRRLYVEFYSGEAKKRRFSELLCAIGEGTR